MIILVYHKRALFTLLIVPSDCQHVIITFHNTKKSFRFRVYNMCKCKLYCKMFHLSTVTVMPHTSFYVNYSSFNIQLSFEIFSISLTSSAVPGLSSDSDMSSASAMSSAASKFSIGIIISSSSARS